MDFERIRQVIIIAICSDDFLMETLVLKGGNALSIVYGIGERTSLDVDFSMEKEFEDLEEAKKRLFRALRDRFDSEGYVVFDEKLEVKPRRNAQDPVWGGYRAEFKLLNKDRYNELSGDRGALSRQAITIGENTQDRKFKIEISKFEYVKGRAEKEIDDFVCYVYTLPMLAAEKIRAVCQQMEDYELRGYRVARARDFYDIHAIVTEGKLDLSTDDFKNVLTEIFKAKKVPLSFIGKIKEDRSFHAQDWGAVELSVLNLEGDFDYYFDFVLKEVEKLKSLWIK